MVALTIVLTGCATEREEVDGQVFVELVEGAIEDARAGGASSGQLAILAEAREAGRVTLEHLREAVRATMQCFSEAGLGSEYVESTNQVGLSIPGYNVFVDEESGAMDDASVEQCDTAHGFWVNKVYQVQPSSDQLWGDYFDRHADELRSCLESAGHEIEAGATGSELAGQANEIAAETNGEVDCVGHIIGG